MPELKKELSLLQATFYGIGIILGAGIYVLLGEAAGIAGNAVWIAFGLAALIAGFTGLSYAELSSMFPKTAAEYVYSFNAFKKAWLSFGIEWIMIFTVIVSAATVALGFARYFNYLFGTDIILTAIALIVLLSAVNYKGIKDSANFNLFSTLVEMAGLVIVIGIGALFFGNFQQHDFFLSPSGWGGILSATSLIFFAYIGFEEMVNVSEETKNASKVIPKALIIALIVSTILYMLVSISAIGVLGWEALSVSQAPLADVVAVAIPDASFVMALIALFATANTVLFSLIVVSRMLYGLSCNNTIPGICSRLSPFGTPVVSIIIVMFLTIGFVLLGNLKFVASLTDVGIFFVYIFVNASLIVLRFSQPNLERPFKTPLNIGKFPILAGLGLLSALFMLFLFEPTLILYEIVLLVIGVIVYKIYSNKIIHSISNQTSGRFKT
ncbi:MAG: APC family permease [archaeon]|nr:APC family permease [archaeon]